MKSPSLGTGAVLIDRYQLGDLLLEFDGGNFWKGVDTVLARKVAIFVIDSSDERAEGLLEAARECASLNDPRILAVLDCGEVGEHSWVISEWGQGLSLDRMLEQGVLSSRRAAWLVREVAEAIALGHDHDIPHGWLNPEAVMVTADGEAKLIGYATASRVRPVPSTHERFGEVPPERADVINLASLLYAALTGKWPGVGESRLPDAPLRGGELLRPRQVRARVPRTLDAIVTRALNSGDSSVFPLESAHEIVAALTDFLGDPAEVAPANLAEMFAEPTSALAPSAIREMMTPTPQLQPGHVVTADDGSDPVGSWDLSEIGEPAASPEPMAHFVDSLEKPLFASTERRAPAQPTTPTPPATMGPSTESHTAGGSSPRAEDREADDSSFWPFRRDEDQPSLDYEETTRPLRWIGVATVAVLILVASFFAFTLGQNSISGPPTPSEATQGVEATQENVSGSGSAAGSATGSSAEENRVLESIKVSAIADFDPFANPRQENPEQVLQAIDGDLNTAWTTTPYSQSADLNGKPGVGLVIDLGRPLRPKVVELQTSGGPHQAQIFRSAKESPTTFEELIQASKRASVDGTSSFDLDGHKTRFLVVWLTRLPAVGSQWQGAINEVRVSG